MINEKYFVYYIRKFTLDYISQEKKMGDNDRQFYQMKMVLEVSILTFLHGKQKPASYKKKWNLCESNIKFIP